MSRFTICTAAALLVASLAPAATPDYEQSPISYSASTPRDAISKIAKEKLSRSKEHGYLESLLRELKISPSSQMLVFSKTSFQQKLISPSRPRAIYFNDDTYIGYVPGGEVIEIAGTDPVLGATFYTIDQSQPVTVARQTENCLQCHGESMTRNTPGLLVRSVFADGSGYPIVPAGGFITTHESPLGERWGGWYVTGTSGAQTHMGNARWTQRDGKDPRRRPADQTDANGLPKSVDTAQYLTPHSDIVALMILEHQVEAHNRATRAAHGTLRALRDEKAIADAMGEPLKPGEHSESTFHRIEGACDPLIEYLLFCGETKLTDPIRGSSDFTTEFAQRGPRDSTGRSLREFDLKTRLFRYPCSYMIYSTAVTGLPGAAKSYLYRRLLNILTDREPPERFAHLTATDRAAIADILRQTHPDLRAAWTKLEQASP
jgi:hypothetical protein